MAELLLTIPEAAERLRLAPLTVQRQLRRGALRGIKRGRVWRVPESALMETMPSPSIASSVETPEPTAPATRAASLLAEMDSGDMVRRNAAIIALSSADAETFEIVAAAAAQAVAQWDGPEDDFADLRALDSEAFGFPDEVSAP